MKSLHADLVRDDAQQRASRSLARAIDRQRDALATDMTRRHLEIPEVLAECGGVVELSGGKPLDVSYAQHYARPLLMLLSGALREPRSAWSSVYLDERARYVPLGYDKAARRALLRRIVEPDLDRIVQLVDPADRIAADVVLRAIHDPLLTEVDLPTVRIAFVGDCLMTEIRASLEGLLRQSGVALESTHDFFNTNLQVAADIGPLTKRIQAKAVDLVALSFLTFEGIPLYTSLLAEAASLDDEAREMRATGLVKIIRNAVESIRASSDIPILLHNASGLPLTGPRRRLPLLPPLSAARRDVLGRINRQLQDLADAAENVILIDEEAACRSVGIRNAAKSIFPRRVWFGSLFHTSEFGSVMAETYAPIALAYARLAKTKVIGVDFDHTLWSGVMAEGDVVHDLEGQRVLKSLQQAGILLVSVSKNDPKNIRWNEMALAEDDFVLHKISWNQKVQSIEEAAQQLNLGIDSFVLLDDNPAERGLVAERQPKVATLDPLDPQSWDWLRYLLKFPTTQATEESRQRTEMYRQAALRREALVGDVDYPAMMRGLALQATWGEVGRSDLDRVAELLQRTNQFNTTTRRQSKAELERLIADPDHAVLAFRLADKFGTYGIVGVVIARHAKADPSIVIDSVVMSCRAMGYGFEQLLVRAPIDVAIAAVGRKPVEGLFVPTARNDPSRSLFEQSGFSPVGDPAAPDAWILAPDDPLPQVPDWLAVTRT